MGLPSQMTNSRTEMWVVRCRRKRAASLPRKGRSCTLVCSQPWAVMPLITDRWSRLSGAPEKRRLAPGGIGLYHQGQQVTAGLVYEDDGSAFVPGLFFRAGQRSSFQRWMASSSRWLARFRGFWRLQLYCLRMRPTWEGWYWTPKWRRMTWVTLGWVHTSPRKPKAWGLWTSNSSNWSRCWWVNLDLRPGGLRWCRAWGPSALARQSHWLTAPLDTPRASAMRCWCHPSWNSSQARRRRPSRQLVACWERSTVIHSVCHPFIRMFTPI